MQLLKKLLLVALLCYVGSLNAQQELGLHFLDHTWQAQQTNPALMSDRKVHVGLISPYLNLYNSGFSFNDIFTDIPGTDSLKLDMDQAIADLRVNNVFQTQINLDVLSLGLRFGNLQVGAGYSIKGSAYMKYPPEMLDVVWNGNADYIGKEVNIAPDFQAYAYNELSVSGAYLIKDKLSIGGRINFLVGVADISSANRDNAISIYTAPDDYAVTLTTDYRYNASGFPELQSTFDSLNTEFRVEKLFEGNFGMAFDFGATYKLNDKLSFAAGFNDLGYIKWVKNSGNYRSEGTYTYDGIDLGPLLQGDTVSFQVIGDTLVDIFNVEQDLDSKSYTTGQAAKLYLSARFQPIKGLTVGGLFYNEIYRGNYVPAISVNVSKDFGEIFSIGAAYSIRNRQFANLGLNTTLRLGPVHFFALTDNFVTMFKPLGSRNFNFRAGLNIAVGKIADSKKPESD